MTNLALKNVSTDQVHAVSVNRVLIAGFTGRDEEAVRHHIDELAELGVPVPTKTPTLYELGPSTVTQSAVIVVAGGDTSGEVEPVLVQSGEDLLLTVGSDHTDRALEKTDIQSSKAACAKILGTRAVPIDAIDDLDAVKLHSSVPGDPDYQEGTMAAIRPVHELLEHLREEHDVFLRDGDVLFLGTVPTRGHIRPAPIFSASLVLPAGDSIDLEYRISNVGDTGLARFDKPELEFRPVAEVPWAPVEGVPGQSERILAPDVANAVATRMLRFEPGTDTRHLGVLRHDFWEEVYILEGELHDLTLNQTFGAGTYACRPPGMPHGPWVSPRGCVTFEVRYGAR